MSERQSGFVAIIPARGGSKGLPRKNLLPLGGKPLICHSIEAGLQCPLVDAVYVSTEDSEIAAVARDAGAEIIDRPASLAADDTTSRDVVLHALDRLEAQELHYESFALLQPTSPLRKAAHLEACLSEFRNGNYGCAISVCEAEHHPARTLVLDEGGILEPWGRLEDLNVPRQRLRKAYRQNGAIYVMRCSDFRDRTDNFFLAPALGFLMSPEASIDIDTELDLGMAQLLVEGRL